MTCIIGYIDEGNVYMGGDSAVIRGTQLDNVKIEKVFQINKFLIGVAGDAKVLSILKYSFEPPEHPMDMPTDKYMNTLFINKLRECFKDSGYATKKDERENFGSTILVGYNQKLFMICCDYCVTEIGGNYMTIGCGDDYASGALYALEGSILGIEDRIYKALETAAKFSNSVCAPFYILKI